MIQVTKEHIEEVAQQYSELAREKIHSNAESIALQINAKTDQVGGDKCNAPINMTCHLTISDELQLTVKGNISNRITFDSEIKTITTDPVLEFSDEDKKHNAAIEEAHKQRKTAQKNKRKKGGNK